MWILGNRIKRTADKMVRHVFCGRWWQSAGWKEGWNRFGNCVNGLKRRWIYGQLKSNFRRSGLSIPGGLGGFPGFKGRPRWRTGKLILSVGLWHRCWINKCNQPSGFYFPQFSVRGKKSLWQHGQIHLTSYADACPSFRMRAAVGRFLKGMSHTSDQQHRNGWNCQQFIIHEAKIWVFLSRTAITWSQFCFKQGHFALVTYTSISVSNISQL